VHAIFPKIKRCQNKNVKNVKKVLSIVCLCSTR